MSVRMILPSLFGVVGVAILLWLGLWQLDRLAWKEGRLAEISEKMAAKPDPLLDHFEKSYMDRNYLRVHFEGVMTQKEAHVLTSLKYSGQGSQSGPGFRILKEVVWNGKNFFLDLGFVSEARKNEDRFEGPVRVVGNILNPDDYDASFTPDPDLDKNIWFARYLPQMAQELGVLPFMVVVEQAEVLKNGAWVSFDEVTPLPVSVNVPNDHSQYAITWFSLATVWFGMTCYLLWRIRQRTV